MASRQAVLGMEQASFFYGSARVFENVSFLLDDARTALVGDNGAGKSTLLKCLGGQLELDGGQVIRSRGLKVGILPQDIPEGLSERPLRDVLGDALQRAGLGDDLRFLLVETGIQDVVRDAGLLEFLGKRLRLLNRDRAHQHRLRRQLRGPGTTASHAQQLRHRGRSGKYR